MPYALQWLTYLNPVRYYLIIIRGTFLKGVGLGRALAGNGGPGDPRGRPALGERFALPEVSGLIFKTALSRKRRLRTKAGRAWGSFVRFRKAGRHRAVANIGAEVAGPYMTGVAERRRAAPEHNE